MVVSDESARLHCRWWNLPYMERYFKVGDNLFIHGSDPDVGIQRILSSDTLFGQDMPLDGAPHVRSGEPPFHRAALDVQRIQREDIVMWNLVVPKHSPKRM